MNQAEVIHASWVHRDSANLSLLDACQADVRDSVVLDVELKNYEQGSLSVGTGPSYHNRKKRQHDREIQKARQMGKELLENCSDGFLIDPSSAHKPTQKRAKKPSKKPKEKEHAASTVPPNMAPPSTLQSTNYAQQQNMQYPAPNPQNPLSFNTPYLSGQPSLHASYPHLPQTSFFTSVPNNNHPWSPPVPHLPIFQTCSQQRGMEWNSGQSPHAYELVILQPNVKKCYGCGVEFTDMYRHAPNNIVVKHMDRRVTGKTPGGQLVYSHDFSNTYYHPSLLHIKRKNPSFNGTVLIDNTLLSSINEEQRQIILTYGFRIVPKH